MNQTKKVAIYTTPSCTYCRMAKEFFKTHNIPYEEFNVATDLKKREEMIEKSGQMGVPVITISGNGTEDLVVGFDQGKLAKLLGV